MPPSVCKRKWPNSKFKQKFRVRRNRRLTQVCWLPGAGNYMLFIIFQAGEDYYALEAHKIIEVVPLLTLRGCPGAPAYIAGLANYRGVGVPVVEFGRLIGRAPCNVYLSTRIIMTSYTGAGGRQRTIGLLAETVTDTVERAEADFSQNNVVSPGHTCLGKLAIHGAGFIQRVLINQLVPKELEPMLFAEQEHPAS